MKLVSSQQANKLVQNIFGSSKSRSVFGVDFSKLNRAEKVAYLQQFLNRTPFAHQEEIFDVLTDSYIRNTTLNASRQSGKCVREDTYVTLADGSIEEIRNLPPDAIIPVATVIGNRITTAGAVLTFTGSKPVFENVYFSSESIVTSDDHRLYRRKTSRPWKDAPVRYHGNDYVRSADQLPRDHIATVGSLTALASAVDYRMDDRLIILLAYQLAEGGFSGTQPNFTNETPEIVAEFAQCIDELGDRLAPGKRRSLGKGGILTYGIANGNWLRWLREWDLHDKNTYTKFIPRFVFQFSQRQLALFLNRFLACDGYAAVSRNDDVEIGVTLANRRLVCEIANIMRILGMTVRVSTQRRPCCYPDGSKKYFTHWSAIVSKSRANYKAMVDIGILSKDHNVGRCHAIVCAQKQSPRYEHSLDGDLRYAFFQKRTPSGEAPCYDLTITIPPEEADETYEPNFIANGFVVHNSEGITWAQAINAIHNLYPALDNTTKVISLANKESQSLIVGNRLRLLLEENWDRTQFFWDRAGSTKTHQVFKRDAGVNTRLTGTIDYLTANPKAFGEGFSASVLFLDEAGRLDPTVYSQVVIPYGASTNAKINLTGVSRGKGPFYDACNSRDYTHLHFPWDKVGTYRRAAPANLIDRYSGQIILETGMYPLRVMPASLKKVLFPTNPIVHVLPGRFQKEDQIELWKLSEGIMSEEDFRSQFCLEWLAALMAILQLEDCQRIFESADYLPPERGIPGEDYWYGFDLAGATNLYASGSHDKDTAALAIWRRRDGIKEKVFCQELYSSQPEEAVQWLMQHVHPHYGIFPCKYGAIDVTGAIGAFASEKIVESRLPVVPVLYNRTEETTKKNWKNAMFDYFTIEMRGGRVRYPRKDVTDELDPDTLKPKNPCWFKAREQWELIERTLTGGLNAQISAPPGEHDDYPNSDALCIFAMDRPQQFVDELHIAKQRARVGSLAARQLAGSTGPIQTFRQQFGVRR